MSRGVFGSGRASAAPGGPRKTGLPRLLELLAENLSRYFLAGIFAVFAGTLYGGAVWAASLSGSILIVLLAGLAAGALLGPALSGLADTILRTLRDMPGSWWETYRRSWKRNAAQSAAFGMGFGCILSGQIFGLCFQIYPGVMLLGMLVLTGISVYLWPQIVLIRLKSGDILKNAMLLVLAHPLQTLKAVAVAAVWAFLLWLLFPVSLFLWAIGGVWFPALLILQILSGVLEDAFHAEAALTGGLAQTDEQGDDRE